MIQEQLDHCLRRAILYFLDLSVLLDHLNNSIAVTMGNRTMLFQNEKNSKAERGLNNFPRHAQGYLKKNPRACCTQASQNWSFTTQQVR